MTKRIAIHKEGHEGLIHVSADTGMMLTPIDQRPEWADGLVQAIFKERNEFYTKRLGAEAAAPLLAADLLSADDLTWVGITNEAEEVEIEASADHRMDQLATVLGIDREDADNVPLLQQSIASAEAAHSYTTDPLNEATLAEIEGQGFEQVSAAVNQ